MFSKLCVVVVLCLALCQGVWGFRHYDHGSAGSLQPSLMQVAAGAGDTPGGDKLLDLLKKIKSGDAGDDVLETIERLQKSYAAEMAKAGDDLSQNGPSVDYAKVLQIAKENINDHLRAVQTVNSTLDSRLAVITNFDSQILDAQDEFQAAQLWVETKNDIVTMGKRMKAELGDLKDVLRSLQTHLRKLRAKVDTEAKSHQETAKYVQLLAQQLLSQDPLTACKKLAENEDVTEADANEEEKATEEEGKEEAGAKEESAAEAAEEAKFEQRMDVADAQH